METHFNKLADDIVLEIAHWLPTTSLIKFLSTCKRFWILWASRPRLRTHVEEFKKMLCVPLKRIKEAVIYAAEHQDFEILELCAKLTWENIWNQCLLTATEHANSSVIEYSLQKGADDFSGALRVAAFKGHLVLVDYFSQKVEEQYAILDAARGGHRELVEYLAKKQQPDDWSLVFSEAVYGGHKQLAEHILNVYQPDLERPLPINWFRPLYGAAKTGDQVFVDWIIQLGAADWHAGLRGASERGHKHLVEFFIQKGATYFVPAIQNAAEINNMEIFQLLINRNPAMVNVGLSTAALHGHRDLMEWCAQHGADDWNSALWKAVNKKHDELVYYIIDKGANNWNSALITAAENGDLTWAEYFIQKGATNLDEALQAAVTAEWVCCESVEQLVRLLVNHGADTTKVITQTERGRLNLLQ